MKKFTLLSLAIAASLTTQWAFAHGHGERFNNKLPSCEQLMNSPLHQARVAQTLAYFDLNKDDQITQDEVQASHQARFSELDADKNGYLSFAELQKSMPNDRAVTTDDQSAHERKGHRGPIFKDNPMARFQLMQFYRLDTNADSQISLTEFTANLPVFDKFDSDGNGIVTKTDLLQSVCSTATTTNTTTVTQPTTTVTQPTTTTETQPTTTVTQPNTTATNDHSGGAPCSTCH